METTRTKLRGVNLGSWLLLEKWMVPSLFEGLEATDETTWCAELGPAATERLRRHWDRFVTREDFAWIAARGLNAVRIPIGHWIFGSDYPYHPKYGANCHPFVDGGIAVLDAGSLETVGAVATTDRFVRLNAAGDGRHALVSTTGGFQVLDAGTWGEAHGNHTHYFNATPC